MAIMSDIQKLITKIEDFATGRDMTPEHLCRLATGNPRLFERLKKRCQQTARDEQRLVKYMDDLLLKEGTPFAVAHQGIEDSDG